MKTWSWSDRARDEFEYLWAAYQSHATAEAKAEYKKWVFDTLMNPYRDGEFIGYWRHPLIQQRIAKMWRRAENGR